MSDVYKIPSIDDVSEFLASGGLDKADRYVEGEWSYVDRIDVVQESIKWYVDKYLGPVDMSYTSLMNERDKWRAQATYLELVADTYKEKIDELNTRLERDADLSNKVWVLTRSINEYNQYGQYFEYVFFSFPTRGELSDILGYGYNNPIIDHILDNGGGRLEFENTWYYLHEITNNGEDSKRVYDKIEEDTPSTWGY